MTTAERIKIYGERNTGTNYLEALLRRNVTADVIAGNAPEWIRWLQRQVPGREAVRDAYFFATERWVLGWKHRALDPVPLARRTVVRRTHVVTVVKNPYSWLVSMARNPYHRQLEASSFSVSVSRLWSEPWPTLRREGATAQYDNAVEMWNDKTRRYLEFADRAPCTLVRYEDLLVSPTDVVGAICAAAGLEAPGDRFQNIESSTKRTGASNDDYQRYYREQRWRNDLSADDIVGINARLDMELLQLLGYERL